MPFSTNTKPHARKWGRKVPFIPEIHLSLRLRSPCPATQRNKYLLSAFLLDLVQYFWVIYLFSFKHKTTDIFQPDADNIIKFNLTDPI